MQQLRESQTRRERCPRRKDPCRVHRRLFVWRICRYYVSLIDQEYRSDALEEVVALFLKRSDGDILFDETVLDCVCPSAEI